MPINKKSQSNIYDNLSREELIDELSALEKKMKKKYGLVWEEKSEKVIELCEEKTPTFTELQSKEIQNDDSSPNILIEGDNYHVLSVLNYTHKGKIDVIYIDPPYNTGARDWSYNNNFIDSEDPYKHTKWISFMSHRLRLTKNLLSNTGIICVTIDDYELPRLWMLMDEIFNQNHLGTIVIRINPGGRKSKRKIAVQHEYALFYSRDFSVKVSPIPKPPEEKNHSYKQDEFGWYEERNLRKEGADSLAKKDSIRYFPIYCDLNAKKLSTITKFKFKIFPIDSHNQKRIWRRDAKTIDEMEKKGDVFVKKTKHGNQIYFKFRGGLDGETPKSMWIDKKFSASEHGTQILDKLLGKREQFLFPKSPHATAECIKVASNKKNSIILDFFAGSGTTGHAVLQLNKEDGGNRKFILCTNNENNICRNICYPRLKKVIKGYINPKGEKVEGLGGNLKYFKTSFIDSKSNDKNKRIMVSQSTEMLCLKEDCFDQITHGELFKIFKNHNDRYLGIVYDRKGIKSFKKAVLKLNKRINVYVFSLDHTAKKDKFKDVLPLVTLKPIPSAILNTYKKIFADVETAKLLRKKHPNRLKQIGDESGVNEV